MAAPKATILLIHGAWHNPSSFDKVIPKLEALSYPVLTVSLPTSGAPAPTPSVNEDIAAIHAITIPLMDAGKEIVIAAHSYGGIPGCASTEGHSIPERAAAGKKGGIKAILFMTAFAIPAKGMTLIQTFGGTYPPWMEQKDGYAIAGSGALEAFYNDLPKDEAEAHFKKLAKQSLVAFETPVNFVAADLKVPSTYMICEKDALLVPAFQEALSGAVPGMKTERCPAGHSPFFSQPDRTVEVLVKVAEE